jgi:hypothetical protein
LQSTGIVVPVVVDSVVAVEVDSVVAVDVDSVVAVDVDSVVAVDVDSVVAVDVDSVVAVDVESVVAVDVAVVVGQAPSLQGTVSSVASQAIPPELSGTRTVRVRVLTPASHVSLQAPKSP